MRLVTFTHDARRRPGLLDGDEVVDLSQAAPDLPTDMCALLSLSLEEPDRIKAALSARGERFPLSDVKLNAPVPRPPKILAVGLNYADHIAEGNRETPEVPMIFNKQSTSAGGPYDDIHLPSVSTLLDYEGEMAFVIGKRCRHVPRDKAATVIAGYTVLNDVSVRDWQMRSQTFTMGKSFDTHCPFGPAIVTPDEIGDPQTLNIRTWVNDELRQESNTRELIFDAYFLVEHLSTAFTLEPGDVIATGTPSGVGALMKPPRFLKADDMVSVEVETLGRISSRVIAEPETTAVY